MTFTDLIIPGDKIDIHVLQELSRAQNVAGAAATLYKSSVSDNLSKLEIEITMPTDGPKMVLFQEGIRLDLVFYTKRGLYQCVGLVKSHYKKGNLYLLAVEQKTDLRKFQRREYFRIDCIQEIKFYPIDEEVAALPNTVELYAKTREPEYILAMSYGKLLDISGGGIRFTDSFGFKAGDYVLTDFRLQNDKIDNSFYLVVQIVGSEEKKDEKGVFINRGKFIYKELSDREMIVRYVFEEERRLRRAEIGD